MSFTIDKKKITKNTITLYLRQAVTMLISFFSVRVTLEQLGVQDYGLNNLVGSIVSMFSFINGSLGTAIQRYYSYEIGKGDESAIKKIFGVGLSLHGIVAIITIVISEIFAIFFLKYMNIPAERYTAANFVFQISTLTLVLGIITVPYSALLRAREMFSKIALIDIFQAVFRLLILYLLILLPFDKLIVLSVLNFIISFVGISAYVILAYKFQETHTHPLWDKSLIKEMLKFVSLLLLAVLASLFNTQGIVMLINLFFGLTVNAAYAVAMQVQNAINTFVTNFKSAMVPQIMASYGAGDMKSMHKMINFGTKVTFIMMLMVSIPITICIQILLKLWLKVPPENAEMFIILSLIWINISSFSYFFAQGIHASGNISKQQFSLSVTYVLAVLISYMLLKLGFNFYTPLYVNMGIGIIQCIINLFFAKKTIDYSLLDFIRKLFIPLIILIILFGSLIGICYFVLKDQVIFIVVSLCNVFITLPVMSVFILFDKSERKDIISFVLSLKNKLKK